MKTSFRSIKPAWLLLALLAITFFLYTPGLSGDFIFDDYPNIVNNPETLPDDLSLKELSEAFSSGIATQLTRPLSMMTFALNYYFTGLDPFYFKLTNVLIHLLICPGLYLLTKDLLILGLRPAPGERRDIDLLAILITAIWALHPLNVSSVLYVVQRMNQLAVLVAVYTLLYYCRFRLQETCTRPQAIRALVTMGLLMVLGVLFKENAILILLYILAVEVFIVQFRTTTPGHLFFVKSFSVLFVAIPALLFIMALFISPESIVGNYDRRTFTLIERVLTEARALWMYIGWVLMPDTRDLIFYYDGFVVSHDLLTPPTTLPSVLGIAGLLIFCAACRKKLPMLCFGIAFFLAGHVLESTIINLELVFEHRNYLPSYGLIFAAVYTLTHLPRAILGLRPAGVFLGLYLLFLAHGTYGEALKWSSTLNHLQTIIAANPDSHRANYSLGFLYNKMASSTPENAALYEAASYFHHRAAELDPIAIRAHVGAIIADSQNGKTLDTAFVDELERRLRTNRVTHRNIREFSLLADCWYRRYCQFDKELLARFMSALAHNEVSDPVIIQANLAFLGMAAATTYRNVQDGLAIMYLARSVRPEHVTIIDLQLIRLEIGLGNYDTARKLLDESRTKQGAELRSEELELLTRELDRLEYKTTIP